MLLDEEIRDCLNKGFWGKAMSVRSLPKEYPAWTLKLEGYVAVAIPYEGEIVFRESFASVSIKTEYDVEIDGEKRNLIMLQLFDMTLRDEFATLCIPFVDPGMNGEKRKKINESPQDWWRNWKDLLGNVSQEKEPYAILGEMKALEYLLEQGVMPEWTGKSGNVHDIETNSEDYEIKSTNKRYGYSVQISSIYQLNPGKKPLELVFCRFEDSPTGESINSVAASLVKKGYDENEIENYLEQNKLLKGTIARTRKYHLLEMKKYMVDDNFPRIIESSFIDNHMPPNVERISYTINISGIPSVNLINGETDV